MIDVTAKGSGSGGGGAGLAVFASPPFGSGDTVIDINVSNVPGSWDASGVYSFKTNLPYTVTMTVEGFTGKSSNTDFTAEVDPQFQIDPLVLNANDYTFEFSPGIGNSALGVPGPIAGAGLPGLLAGFGAMLAWYRKRRAVAA